MIREDISKIKKNLDREHMTWGDLAKKMSKVLGQIAYDGFFGSNVLKQKEMLEKVNSIDLSTPEKLNQAEQKMYGYWVKSLTGGNLRDREICYQTCIALTTRVMAGKSGFVDAQVDFYSDGKSNTQAYVQPKIDDVIRINLASITFSRENLFNEPIFPISDIAGRLKKIGSEPIMTIAHEIQHFSQHKQVLREEENNNPSNVTQVLKQEDEIRETQNGQKFYSGKGHDAFSSEIDANVAGLFDGSHFVDGLLGYIEKEKTAENKDPNLNLDNFPDIEAIRQRLDFFKKVTAKNETKLIEELAEFMGYEVDKNGNFVTRKDIKSLVASFNEFEEEMSK